MFAFSNNLVGDQIAIFPCSGLGRCHFRMISATCMAYLLSLEAGFSFFTSFFSWSLAGDLKYRRTVEITDISGCMGNSRGWMSPSM